MQKGKKIYTFGQLASGILMLLALLWLTVSLPYVNEAQQKGKASITQQMEEKASEDEGNPLANTTEEKTESGVNQLSEYLHNIHILEHHFTEITTFYKCHPSDLYFEFHPELLSPPPEA